MRGSARFWRAKERSLAHPGSPDRPQGSEVEARAIASFLSRMIRPGASIYPGAPACRSGALRGLKPAKSASGHTNTTSWVACDAQKQRY